MRVCTRLAGVGGTFMLAHVPGNRHASSTRTAHRQAKPNILQLLPMPSPVVVVSPPYPPFPRMASPCRNKTRTWTRLRLLQLGCQSKRCMFPNEVGGRGVPAEPFLPVFPISVPPSWHRCKAGPRFAVVLRKNEFVPTRVYSGNMARTEPAPRVPPFSAALFPVAKCLFRSGVLGAAVTVHSTTSCQLRNRPGVGASGWRHGEIRDIVLSLPGRQARHLPSEVGRRPHPSAPGVRRQDLHDRH